MFERFSNSARRALALAQEAAQGLGHGFIGGEHLLLGIAEEEGGAGQQVLSAFATARLLRHEVADLHAGLTRPGTGHIPFTPAAKRALELAHRQSVLLGVEAVDSAVLLLGVLEERGSAVNLLHNAGVDIDALRRTAIEAVTGGVGNGAEPPVAAQRQTARCPACSVDLQDNLKLEQVKAAGDGDGRVSEVQLAYCGRCGASAGVVAAR